MPGSVSYMHHALPEGIMLLVMTMNVVIVNFRMILNVCKLHVGIASDLQMSQTIVAT